MNQQEPESVRVRLSGDPGRSIELALHQGRGFAGNRSSFHLTRSQGRHVMLALQATLVRTLPGPIIHRDGTLGGPRTTSQGGDQ